MRLLTVILFFIGLTTVFGFQFSLPSGINLTAIKEISKKSIIPKLAGELAVKGLNNYNLKHRERSDLEDNVRVVASLTQTQHYLEIGEAMGHLTADAISHCETDVNDPSYECQAYRYAKKSIKN